MLAVCDLISMQTTDDLAFVSVRIVSLDEMPGPDRHDFKSKELVPKGAFAISFSSRTNPKWLTDTWENPSVAITDCRNWKNRDDFHGDDDQRFYQVSLIYWQNLNVSCEDATFAVPHMN